MALRGLGNQTLFGGPVQFGRGIDRKVLSVAERPETLENSYLCAASGSPGPPIPLVGEFGESDIGVGGHRVPLGLGCRCGNPTLT